MIVLHRQCNDFEVQCFVPALQSCVLAIRIQPPAVQCLVLLHSHYNVSAIQYCASAVRFLVPAVWYYTSAVRFQVRVVQRHVSAVQCVAPSVNQCRKPLPKKHSAR